MITITEQTIYDKVVEFSSFEAGRGVQDDGLYQTIIVTTRDKTFIASYAEQAMTMIGALLKFCIADYGEQAEGGYGFAFRPDCIFSVKEARAKKHITEAMVAYVMSRWLDNKIPERARAYATMYTDMTALLVNSADRVRPALSE